MSRWLMMLDSVIETKIYANCSELGFANTIEFKHKN